MRETWVESLGCEDPLEKEMATHFSILAWKIPRTEDPGGLQLQKGVAKSCTWLSTHTYTFIGNMQNKITVSIFNHRVIYSSFFSTLLTPQEVDSCGFHHPDFFLLCDWFQLMGSTSRKLDGRRREWSESLPPFPILLPALLWFCQWPVTVTASVKCWNSSFTD